MHNHNNNDSGGGPKGMMWMMIPCLILLGVLFLGGGKLSSGYLWPVLIGVFVVAHVWMMFKGHRGHKDDSAEDKIDNTSAKQPEIKDGNDKHKSGGCCH